ncbi:hypothetical protein BGZ89_011578, partial [Linnemannia elongata]
PLTPSTMVVRTLDVVQLSWSLLQLWELPSLLRFFPVSCSATARQQTVLTPTTLSPDA